MGWPDFGNNTDARRAKDKALIARESKTNLDSTGGAKKETSKPAPKKEKPATAVKAAASWLGGEGSVINTIKKRTVSGGGDS